MQKFTSELKHSFQGLLDTIAEWCEKHSDVIRQAYLSPKPSQPFKYLLLFVVTGDSYNPDVEDEVIKLDTALHERFKNVFQVRLQFVPESVEQSVECFVDAEHALALYANDKTAQSPS